jgi:hypothetical protein
MKKQVSQATMEAMKQLLEHYKNPKEKLEDCPLCTLHNKYAPDPYDTWRYVCSTCPWILFGYKGEKEHPDAYGCENWFNTQYPDSNVSISIVRTEPAQFDRIRRKRIGMLVQWIRNSEVV